jgi:hypothetical protein
MTITSDYDALIHEPTEIVSGGTVVVKVVMAKISKNQDTYKAFYKLLLRP